MAALIELALPILCIILIGSRYFNGIARARLDVPTVTFGRFIPNFINRLLFTVAGRYIVHKGYKQYKNVPFRILKIDADVIVLPARYLPYIRTLGEHQISLIEAQSANVCGEYINILLGTNLPSITVGKKLTPAMNRLIPRVIEELDHAFAVEMPQCNDWTEMKLYSTILKLITRSTSRIIVGKTLCRDEVWLNTITEYSEQLGMTLVTLRPLPLFLRPFVASVLPSVKYLKKTLDDLKDQLFVPIILARREAEAKNPNLTKPDDFIQWMMDTADNDFDRDPENIAYGVMAIMAIAITHTTTMLITQGLYDLMMHPEYIGPLKREIKQTLKNGWVNATVRDFTSQRLLDSFLRESQRLNPSSEYNVHRTAKQPITFPDGFHLPEGTYFVFASGPLSIDPSIVRSPETFDGYRWCYDHLQHGRASNRPIAYQSLVTLNESNLHFGYGREACPGRFFGAHTAKALLSRLLVEYELQILDEEWFSKYLSDGIPVRPWNIRNGEHIMPNPFTKVMIRKTGERI
ncbi:cytochrome P450 [Aspergillus karnatakaensis]|uniref:cytochrome P450 n=1 Tax=Aspergillus karnatakaensis TaxID=1810916 RepID=UPI003CCDDFB3